MQNDEYKDQRMISAEAFTMKLENKLYAILDINAAGESEKAYEMLCSVFGHSERHIAQTDGQLLKRVIDEGRPASSFESKSDYIDFITNALIKEENSIAKWIQGDGMDRREYNRMTLTVDMGENVGNGWLIENGNYQKKETDIMRVVLERDTYRKSMFPFYPVTVYADISRNEARNMGDKVHPYDVAYDKEVEYEGRLERCLARYRGELPREYEAEYMPKNGDYPEGIKITGNGIKVYMRDRETQLEVTGKNNDRCSDCYGRHIDIDALKVDSPELSFFIDEMSAAYNMVRTGNMLPGNRARELSDNAQDRIRTLEVEIEDSSVSGKEAQIDQRKENTKPSQKEINKGKEHEILEKTDNGYRLSASLDSILSGMKVSSESPARKMEKEKDSRPTER